jgi:hypothetical protein
MLRRKILRYTVNNPLVTTMANNSFSGTFEMNLNKQPDYDPQTIHSTSIRSTKSNP